MARPRTATGGDSTADGGGQKRAETPRFGAPSSGNREIRGLPVDIAQPGRDHGTRREGIQAGEGARCAREARMHRDDDHQRGTWAPGDAREEDMCRFGGGSEPEKMGVFRPFLSAMEGHPRGAGENRGRRARPAGHLGAARSRRHGSRGPAEIQEKK